MFGEFFAVISGFFYTIGKGVKLQADVTSIEAYRAQRGYNKERQSELQRMAYRNYADFKELLGRNYNRSNDYEVDAAIAEILETEGFEFYSVRGEVNDPIARKLMGSKH